MPRKNKPTRRKNGASKRFKPLNTAKPMREVSRKRVKRDTNAESLMKSIAARFGEEV